MAVPSTGQDSLGEHEPRDEDNRHVGTAISMHCTRPERSIFVENDNADGWIATDLTVDLKR